MADSVIGYTNTRKDSTKKVFVMPRQEVRILTETYPENAEKSVNIRVERGKEKKTTSIYWRDSVTPGTNIHTPDMPLWKNEPFSLLLPRGREETICNIFADSQNPLQLPLHPFMNDLCHPVKIYNYQPAKAAPGTGTSYFKSIGIEPVKDDGSSMMFIQEMKNRRLNMPDGPVQIDHLSEQDVDIILKEILGDDYLSRVEKKTDEEAEGKSRITTPLGTAAKAGYKSYDKLIKTHILQDFGYKGKFYIKTVKGKQYVYLDGNRKWRKYYTRQRYKVTNPKVVNLTAGGQLTGSVTKSAMKGNFISFVIVGSIDVFEWLLNKDNDKHVSDLFVTLGMDALKVVVASLITAGFVALILTLLASATIPVLAVVAGAIVIGLFVGKILDIFDENIGATQYMQIQARKGIAFLEQNETWQRYIAEPLGRLNYQLEEAFKESNNKDNLLYRQMQIVLPKAGST